MTAENAAPPEHIFSDERFDSLDLHPKVREGLRAAGFEKLTPIQAKSLPLALAGTDVAGQAQTGTGKTAAFLIALFNKLLTEPPLNPDDDHNPRAVVLAPTRELAIQIHRDAELLGGPTGLRLVLAYGGIDYEKQRRQLGAGSDLLIGTPGRIIDYFKQRVFNFKNVQVCVLDEADRMFDLGFIRDIRYMLRRMPPPRQRLNLLFSATLSYRVTELAYEHMNDPTRVEIESESMTAEEVNQRIYFPANAEKMRLLVGLLRRMDIRRTMVFCNMKVTTDRVAATLNANGFEAAVLSGDVRQKKRQTLLRRFHEGDLPILVATDVAARGLHIPEVSHVVNFDLPQDPEDYVHRIGRTARLGESGEAISFACENYAATLPDIEEFVGQKIEVEAVAGNLADDINTPARKPRRPRRGGGGRNRKGKGDQSQNRGRRKRPSGKATN